eukprot:SAG22_NODE_707_length_7758_cov_8.503199_6_plen_165_part_00
MEGSQDYQGPDTECSICLCPLRTAKPDAEVDELTEDLANGRALPCEHVFHHMCIAKWFCQSETCPLCRAEHDAQIRTLKPHVLFLERQRAFQAKGGWQSAGKSPGVRRSPRAKMAATAGGGGGGGATFGAGRQSGPGSPEGRRSGLQRMASQTRYIDVPMPAGR